MPTSVLVILAAGAVLVLLAFLSRRPRVGGEWPFYARKPLSIPEQVMYHRLVKSLPQCMILAQVQASRLLGVKRGYDFHRWANRINRLSVDYVVCHRDSTVIAALELDDASHQARGREEVVWRKERAFKAAGVPLLRWSVRDLPDEAAIRAALEPVLNRPAATP